MVMAFHMVKPFLPSSCLAFTYLASCLVPEASMASYLMVTYLASFLASYLASFLRVAYLASYQAFTFIEAYQMLQVISHIHHSYS